MSAADCLWHAAFAGCRVCDDAPSRRHGPPPVSVEDSGVPTSEAFFDQVETDDFRKSPFAAVYNTRKSIRYRLAAGEYPDIPLLLDLISEGTTDYVAYPLLRPSTSMTMGRTKPNCSMLACSLRICEGGCLRVPRPSGFQDSTPTRFGLRLRDTAKPFPRSIGRRFIGCLLQEGHARIHFGTLRANWLAKRGEAPRTRGLWGNVLCVAICLLSLFVDN